ncbi:alpha/beta fold hydrolase [Thauera linaloolentis]|uniref:Alpha/beta hydrolase n=1 Tax=Thauera linaloolentis (strain DSM 12138 / JCM 21573 / CCUG 41526 / CIP 105981 / IAM 15112 / NBRC 102519 / 47Lol) TaxID=1123367 RepID=N6Z756_THAL4|nr:alpha/beta hydrolase [Thauera linaloolentis]ENO90203.1 alpha/beta hydrolase [Thauera linaloolentis 47Lol = DSM 12138]MCM8564660.1 alpha/beta hydrolase [Thauera linaloolentis]
MKEIELRGQPVALFDNTPPQHTDAPPWLLVHGAGHDHAVWDEIAAGLATRGERVLMPDLPGHGGSGGGPLPDVDAMAGWILALADALGHERIRLCGHSMGSLVALAAAGKAPARIDRLALIGASVPMPVSPFLLDAARDDPEQAFALINKFSFAPAEILGDARRAEFEATNLRRMQQQGARVLASDLSACNAWQDGLAAAARVRCPTLVISGGADRMTPADSVKPLFDSLEKEGCSARMIVLAGAGHAMMQEAPEALVDALLRGL